MSARRNRPLVVVAVVLLAGTATAMFVLLRPQEVHPVRTVVPVQDENHFPPGSPAAVAESFLRSWWRAHYEDARLLSTGALRERCTHNHAKTFSLTPPEAEQLRQVQHIAEATHFDLERVALRELPLRDGTIERRELSGEVHAHGQLADGRRVESRRGQIIVLELVEGAWRVSAWTPARADAGIMVY